MKHVLCLLMIFAGAACAEEMKWDDLCYHATNRALTIKTAAGTTVTGTCFLHTDHGITLNVKRGQQTVARDDISTVRLDNYPKSHCFARVGAIAGEFLVGGMFIMASPEFMLSPVFIAASPVIFAGGAPVCAVYDLANRLTGSHKITII